ncbi:hypothetical protein IL972_17120 [Acinetobacter sp. FL51]|uniref:hypothetical protein n=1 Tax=Acinetobacter sp. FL51 TaxID=2777978 RepID=UPI0018E1BB01|nr:hypothetical protein [Acinetobacter sp. FL51]MBI1453619.1 hypothetical protein [Acinetobacter sp. FL51]
MYEDFKLKYSGVLQAIDSDGDKIEFQFFSQYTPEQAIEKSKDYWTYDLIKFKDFPTPQRFEWGKKTIIHPQTQKEYAVIYDEVKNES